MSTKRFTVLIIIMMNVGLSGYAQTSTITIEQCYKLARQQYPLIKQHDLIEKTKDFTIQNAARGYYPQFTVNGQLTYQSAVTSLGISGIDIPHVIDISIPTPPLTQYNIHGELDQTIYDGGIIKQQKKADVANADIQQQNVEVQLYALKDRINQIYFGVLVIDEQIKQNDLTQKDLQNSIDKMQEGVKNGTATTSSVAELMADLEQQQQNKIQFQASRKAYLDMLGVFTNQTFSETTTLQIPVSIIPSDSIKRPELNFYDFQKANDLVQENLLNATNRPKFSAFFQGGYALPGLNVFDVNPSFYYLTGLRLTWNIAGYYTQKNQKQILELDRQNIDVQRETFLFNTNITLKQQNSDIVKLKAMIDKDNDIIEKRTEVKDASKAQMENGTATIHEYVGELDAEDQAKQSLILHEMQLLLAEYTYQNTTGNL